MKSLKITKFSVENFFFKAKDPWSEESQLYLHSNDLILVENGAGAESLASIIFLKELNLKFEIEYAKNVNEMSPSGKQFLTQQTLN